MSHADHGTAVDEPVERTYVDWPEDTEVSTIEQLATLLERDVDDIDDWIHGALAEDPGDAHVEHDDESIAFVTLARSRDHVAPRVSVHEGSVRRLHGRM